jgi:chorismate mutase
MKKIVSLIALCTTVLHAELPYEEQEQPWGWTNVEETTAEERFVEEDIDEDGEVYKSETEESKAYCTFEKTFHDNGIHKSITMTFPDGRKIFTKFFRSDGTLERTLNYSIYGTLCEDKLYCQEEKLLKKITYDLIDEDSEENCFKDGRLVKTIFYTAEKIYKIEYFPENATRYTEHFEGGVSFITF